MIVATRPPLNVVPLGHVERRQSIGMAEAAMRRLPESYLAHCARRRGVVPGPTDGDPHLERARRALVADLARGDLHGEGLRPGDPSPHHEPIGAHDWTALTPRWGDDSLLNGGAVVWAGIRISTASPIPTASPTRRTGGRDYRSDDAPLIDEVLRLVSMGEASSIRAASLRVAVNATGGGTLDARARRITARIRALGDPK